MLLLLFPLACNGPESELPTNDTVQTVVNPPIEKSISDGNFVLPESTILPPSNALIQCQLETGLMNIRFFEDILSWGDQQVEISAGFQTALCIDLENDGVEEAYLGFGMSRAHPKAQKQIWKLSGDTATKIWELDGERNQITGLNATLGNLYLTAFTEGTNVSSGPLIDGVWQPEYNIKLALRQIPTNMGVLIGRIYGDEPRSDGDLKLFTDAGIKEFPISGGVRGLATADINQDGHSDFLVSDGWHYQYGNHAKARVRIYLGPEFTDIRTIANFDDDYTVERIFPIIRKDGVHLVVQASTHVYWLEPSEFGWKVNLLAQITETGFVQVHHHGSVHTISISGNPSLQFGVQ
jgi:hypothetical protein